MVEKGSGELLHRLSSRLKMRHLILLLQIQQHGSLTRVAEHMASSQPAVTNALAELESMFGGPLFDRSSRGMAPTALGKRVLARAQAMIHDLGHLARDVESASLGRAVHLHVGVTPFIPGRLLSAAIQRAFPDTDERLTVTIHEGTSDQLLSQLRDHSLDIVLGRISSTVELENVRFDVLYRQQPRLIASRRLAAQLGRVRLDWRQLAELDWILGAPHTRIREQVADIFLAAGVVPPAPIVESYSSKLIGEMIVASDHAVSIVPADIAEEMVRTAGVAIVPYSFNWNLPPIAIFTRAESLPAAAVELFGAALLQLCKESQIISLANQ
ncbi:LysR substrate-binding domain-containing protein [Crenobacter sp. SG2305]|uniref:LysR substrate-binding domain-containing protein n=1 Tax=Crenobacter oryzisoli TaxID=3056844 RepID=UPI0025AB53DD|nr:LysR substrate-binding domain-containing protein [Crenobacter sp. SG2305]MDN0083225.1 LysR substrate-binding domain-containing protein [Crenobacter sp. SG2305]